MSGGIIKSGDEVFYKRVFFLYFIVLSPLVLTGKYIGIGLSSLEELFWPGTAMMATVLTLAKGRLRYPKRFLLLVFFFFVMMAIKAVLGFMPANDLFGANGYFLEFKFLFFMIIVLLITTAYPVIDTAKMQPYFLFFAFLEILDWAITVKLRGAKRTSILSEQNYDGFLILVGYVLLIKKEKLDWPKIIVYSLATYCTSSRTGLVTLLFISLIRLRKMRNKLLYVGIIASMALVTILVFIRRLGSLQLEALDRFVMLKSFLERIKEFNAGQLVFGTVSGIPLAESDTAMTFYIQEQSEPLGLIGLHPFNFHGFFMRFVSSYGIFAFFALCVAFLAEVRRDKAKIYLLILAAMQMFSLSLFYLTVIAAPLLIFIFARDDSMAPACDADEAEVEEDARSGANGNLNIQGEG